MQERFVLAWLLQFFAALERKEGRAAILAGVREVKASFKTQSRKSRTQRRREPAKECATENY